MCLKLHPKELNANPFSKCNSLVYVGLRTHDGRYLTFPIEYSYQPYGEALKLIQQEINNHDCIIGFNLKFDLHWIKRYNLDFSNKRVFDCQLCEFCLSNQLDSFPSLDSTALKHGFEGKLDVIKLEYWDKGIDTELIPKEILEEYLIRDLDQTYKVFQKQQSLVKEKRTLVSLCNQDLLVLQEMEWNGMLYDVKQSLEKGDALQKEINDIDKDIIERSNFPHLNIASGDHLSAILYGGSIKIPFRESYVFTYKSGKQAVKERWSEQVYTFQQLIKPLKGSELKKEGFYATNFDTLSTLKCKGKAKELVNLILQRSKLEKLRGTYLHGIPSIMKENDWEEDYIHGQLNQCVAVTGRLSSSKPNLQNMDGSIGYLFGTRYAD